MKFFLIVSLLGFSSFAHSGGVLSTNSAPIIPPVQMSIVGQSMGNAIVGDGTLFNATSFNPALLGQAPGTLELLQLEGNVSNDVFSEINNYSNFNFDSLGSIGNILDGYVNNNASEINSALTPLDSFSGTFLNKNLQLGLSDNLAVKVTNNFGIEVYNNSQLLVKVLPGTTLQSLTSVPINSNSVSGVGAAVTIFQNGIQNSVNQFLTTAEQSGSVTIAQDIQNLKNGGGGNIQAAANKLQTDAKNILGVDLSNLYNQIANTLLQSLIYVNALAYSDTVAMGTIDFDPFEDFPLTVGINGKVVRRYFSWAAQLAPSTNIVDQGNNLGNDLQQPATRWGVDLGFLYKPESDLNFGLSFEDLLKSSATIPNSSVPGDVLYQVITDPAPTVTRIGVSWHPLHEFVLNGDMDDVFSTTSYYTGLDLFSHLKFGAALTLAGILQLRGGFGENNLSGGAGIQLGFVGLDYSYAMDELSYTYNHYAQFKLVF
ncbi:MAG TPA: hypothetical protein VK791_01970 [bacterium]|nr:hypothetical protein [bacterium]